MKHYLFYAMAGISIPLAFIGTVMGYCIVSLVGCILKIKFLSYYNHSTILVEFFFAQTF